MHKNKIKILRRARSRRLLRYRHVNSLRAWRQHVKELELEDYIKRITNGKWIITQKGINELKNLEDEGQQTSLSP